MTTSDNYEIEAAGDNPLQRNAEWFAARCGCLTGSRVADALATLRNGAPAKASEDMLVELVTERLTGHCVEHFQSDAMRWGTEQEGAARDAYEAETGNMVDLVGFVHHPSIEWLGASPDGLVGEDGMVEIKCPTTTTHVRRLMDPEQGVRQYKYQMMLQLACTGRAWCDMVDYDPRMRSERLQLIVTRFVPDPAEMSEFLNKCRAFLDRVAAKVEELEHV